MSERSNSFNAPFPTTQWSQVVKANVDAHDSETRSALNDLCGRYWRPIYSFARHQGCSPSDAEDLTQGFFARILESGYLREADRRKGKFRTFLIHDFKFFLSNHRGKQNAVKRGGNAMHVPIDTVIAETDLELADPRLTDPDLYFDRQWALEVMRQAKQSVAEFYESQGNIELFETLREGLIQNPDSAQYDVWSAEFGMTVEALRVAMFRLRTRLRESIEKQILATLGEETKLKEEMRHLKKALSYTLESS